MRMPTRMARHSLPLRVTVWSAAAVLATGTMLATTAAGTTTAGDAGPRAVVTGQPFDLSHLQVSGPKGAAVYFPLTLVTKPVHAAFAKIDDAALECVRNAFDAEVANGEPHDLVFVGSLDGTVIEADTVIGKITGELDGIAKACDGQPDTRRLDDAVEAKLTAAKLGDVNEQITAPTTSTTTTTSTGPSTAAPSLPASGTTPSDHSSNPPTSTDTQAPAAGSPHAPRGGQPPPKQSAGDPQAAGGFTLPGGDPGSLDDSSGFGGGVPSGDLLPFDLSEYPLFSGVPSAGAVPGSELSTPTDQVNQPDQPRIPLRTAGSARAVAVHQGDRMFVPVLAALLALSLVAGALTRRWVAGRAR